jgi:type II secretory pathway pseudopilin PulG
MRAPGLKRRVAVGGFTLVESLLALVLTAVGTGIISDTLTGILRRSYITISVTRISDESERLAAAFTQQGKTAVGWALYADRAAYLADPVANVAPAGNLLVFQDQLSDGTVINELFEYDPGAQTLGRYEGDFTQQRTLLNNVVFSAGFPTAFAQNFGLVQAHWSVQSPYEQLDFESYGSPLRMR